MSDVAALRRLQAHVSLRHGFLELLLQLSARLPRGSGYQGESAWCNGSTRPMSLGEMVKFNSSRRQNFLAFSGGALAEPGRSRQQ